MSNITTTKIEDNALLDIKKSTRNLISFNDINGEKN